MKVLYIIIIITISAAGFNLKTAPNSYDKKSSTVSTTTTTIYHPPNYFLPYIKKTLLQFLTTLVFQRLKKINFC